MITDKCGTPDALSDLYSVAAHFVPLLRLLETVTGVALLKRPPGRLLCSADFNPDGGWLARVSDDESPGYIALRPVRFDRPRLSRLWARADVVCVYAGAADAAHYSFTSLALVGHRASRPSLLETHRFRRDQHPSTTRDRDHGSSTQPEPSTARALLEPARCACAGAAGNSLA
jgi:hypothetical protein